MATGKLVFCDTNILLDFFDPARPGHTAAIALLWYAAENPDVRLVASIGSFKDAYYILTRLYKDEPRARKNVRQLMGELVEPVDLLANYGNKAMDCGEPDFEDALIRISAEHEGAHALVTRDGDAFAGSRVPPFTAEAFLSHEGFEYEEVAF